MIRQERILVWLETDDGYLDEIAVMHRQAAEEIRNLQRGMDQGNALLSWRSIGAAEYHNFVEAVTKALEPPRPGTVLPQMIGYWEMQQVKRLKKILEDFEEPTWPAKGMK